MPWLGWTCGSCEFCRGGRENLCAKARFTGYHFDGGYASHTLADARYCFAMPEGSVSIVRVSGERDVQLIAHGITDDLLVSAEH